MKIRIKFAKSGAMKFIGHLDIMRYFQKSMSRADIPIAYSAGFNPHQVMSFAAPLGVGLTSEGEYLDIEIEENITSKEAIERLTEKMAEGIVIKSFRRLPDNAQNAMSSVAAADYRVTIREGYEISKNWQKEFLDFCSQESIEINKKTKKSEKLVDIKPMIYKTEIQGEGIFIQTATGSAANLKAELVFEAFCQKLDIEYNPFMIEVCRLETYGDIGGEDRRELMPLEDFGEDM